MSKTELHNDEIERKAERILTDKFDEIFRNNNFKIIDHKSSKGEVGIDIFFQVLNRSNHTDALTFNLQSKGTNGGIKINKKGVGKDKISFQLDLRHPVSWLNNYEALIFAYCDINSGDIYWYCIQNDSTIAKRIEEQKKKRINKLQIYIAPENIINEENFNRFIEDIHQARKNQISRIYPSMVSKIEINDKISDYTFIKKEVEGKHIIDKLNRIIELFENIVVIPEHIIDKLFYNAFGKRTYISESSIRTQSEEFFTLIENIINTTNESGDEIFQLLDGKIYVDKQEEKLKGIINFFRVNLIYHMDWSGKGRKSRICVHNLFTYNSCDCERCNFEKLNLSRANELLNENSNEYSIYENMRKGYTAYLFGNTEQTVDIFLSILNEIDKSIHPIKYLTIKLNLTELKRINKRIFDWSESVSEKLKNVKIDSEDFKLLNNKSQWFLDVFNSIKSYKVLHNSLYNIDSLLQEIRNVWLSDSNGGWTSNSRLHNLKTSFLRTQYFYEHNLILLNHYDEHKALCEKVLEGLFALYTLKNKKAQRYEAFDFTIIEMWIFYVRPDTAKFLLNKYNINKISINEKTFFVQKLKELFNNLNNSIGVISKSEETHFFFKLERVVKNLLMIISKLDLTSKQLNYLLSKNLYFSEQMDKHRLICFDGIMRVVYSSKSISNENIRRIINLSIKNKRVGQSNFSYLIKYFVENNTKEEIKALVFELLEVSNFNTLDINEESYFNDLWFAYTFLDNQTKNDLRHFIIKKLNNNFEVEIYHLATLYEIIDFDKTYFDKFLKTIPNQNEQLYFRAYNESNTRLGQAINLAYKFNIPFNKSIQKYIDYCIESKRDYYRWLMNLDSFDYSIFDPYWLVGVQTKYYIDAFKSSKSFMRAIKNLLKENYDEKLAKFYFQDLL